MYLRIIILLFMLQLTNTYREEDSPTIICEGNYDIVNIFVQKRQSVFNNTETDKYTIFYIEADPKNPSLKTYYKGLYKITANQKYIGPRKKLLDNARDITGRGDVILFASNDGIYKYDMNSQTAEKYGSITEDIISIAIEQKTGIIYIVTSNHQAYKVIEDGSKYDIFDNIINPEKIMINEKDDIFYYTQSKQFYLHTASGSKKIKGLPEFVRDIKYMPTSVDVLIKARLPLTSEDSLITVGINNDLYGIFKNQTAYPIFRWNDTVTAASAQYYDYAVFAGFKKLYGFTFNFLLLALAGCWKS